jgi:hypothetical protein
VPPLKYSLIAPSPRQLLSPIIATIASVASPVLLPRLPADGISMRALPITTVLAGILLAQRGFSHGGINE